MSQLPLTVDFSNPAVMFNNIFWNNEACTLDTSQVPPALTGCTGEVNDPNATYLDFEVHGTGRAADTFTPRFSILTNGQIRSADGQTRNVPGGQGNQIGLDPGFVTPFVNELTVSGSRLDPQTAAVTITGADPPVGLTGDYHITAASPAVDRGAGFSNLAAAAPLVQTPNAAAILAPCSGTAAQGYPAYFDRQFRPQIRTLRVRTPWDIGADELAGVGIPIPRTGSPAFNWNGTGQLQCSGSTETR